ncbi:MAG: pitrilysin family protein [Pseudomonadota bacterium]
MLLAFGHAGTARALTLPPGVVQGPAVAGITEYRLANGLKVLLFPDASKPTVTVNVTYLVGSRHENYGETGMAHLLEHLMFKGAPGFAAIPAQFARRGMDYNGTTGLDRTNYYEIFQASEDNLRWALRMEAARMTGSAIARKDLDTEMTVVRNEYESGENSPAEVLFKRLQSVAFDWHSYGRSPIGNRSDIENVRIANLQAFYRTWYQPDNAVLLVAGKFDPQATLGAIAQSFGPIPKPARTLPPFWTVEPVQDGERSVTVRRQGDYQIVALAYKVPAALHDDSDLLAFASEILCATPSGRLHKLLVESGQASEVFCGGETGVAPGLRVIGAVLPKDGASAPVVAALVAAAEGFAASPPTPLELERVRRNFLNQIDKSLNNPQQVGVALSEAIALGDWRLYFVGRERIGSATAAEVAAAAGRYLRRDNRVTGHYLPDDAPRRAPIPPAPSVGRVLQDFKPQTADLVSENFEPSQDNILKRTLLSNVGGLKLALLPKKNRGQTVNVVLRLHWGNAENLFGKGTLQAFALGMLTRGTSRYTREQLSDAFEKLRITGGPMQFETTRTHLAESLRLVAHVLKEPNFPAAEFAQLRQQALLGLEAGRGDPESVAARALGLHFNNYPPGDVRAVRSIDADIAELKAAGLDQVRDFHREFFGASHGEMAIVGDFDAPAIAPLVAELFGAWQSRAAYAPLISTNAKVAPLRQTINVPEKENGVFSARLNLDLNLADPEYPALMLANYIFGEGGLKSRLMDRIRQKDGLSYGGGAQLAPGDIDRAGMFGIGAIAAPQNMARLDAAIRDELARAVRGGFSARELADAKSGLLQQRLQNRAQDAVLASGWANFLYLGQTFAFSREFERKLAAVTLAELNAAFRKAIDPAALSVVIAADSAKAAAPK